MSERDGGRRPPQQASTQWPTLQMIRDSVPWWMFIDESLVPTIWIVFIFTLGVVCAWVGLGMIIIGYIMILIGGIGYSLGRKAGQNS